MGRPCYRKHITTHWLVFMWHKFWDVLFFAGESAKEDTIPFVENETHQVLWRSGGGRRQESLQGAHILLEPSGLRFFLKMNGKKIHIRMSFEFILFTIQSTETCSSPRRVEVTQAWPHEPVSWARLLKNLSAKERLGGWSSYQIGWNWAVRYLSGSLWFATCLNTTDHWSGPFPILRGGESWSCRPGLYKCLLAK